MYSSLSSRDSQARSKTRTYNQPNPYYQGTNINRDMQSQRNNLFQEYSGSSSENYPIKTPSRLLRFKYFKLVYKEDFVEFVQKQEVTEEDWYNSNEIDKISLYSEYDKHIQYQKKVEEYKKEAEKEIEIERERAQQERREKEKEIEERKRERIEKEKAMEALKEKEQKSLKERERAEQERERAEQERERAERAERALMEMQLERAEKLKEENEYYK